MPGKNFARPRPVNLSDKREKGCGNGAIPSGWFPHCQHQPEKTTIVTCLGIYCNSRTDRRIILSFSFYQFVLKCSPGFWKSSRNLPPVLKARDVANGTKHMEDGEKVKALWKRWMNACIGKKSAGSSFVDRPDMCRPPIHLIVHASTGRCCFAHCLTHPATQIEDTIYKSPVMAAAKEILDLLRWRSLFWELFPEVECFLEIDWLLVSFQMDLNSRFHGLKWTSPHRWSSAGGPLRDRSWWKSSNFSFFLQFWHYLSFLKTEVKGIQKL